MRMLSIDNKASFACFLQAFTKAQSKCSVHAITFHCTILKFTKICFQQVYYDLLPCDMLWYVLSAVSWQLYHHFINKRHARKIDCIWNKLLSNAIGLENSWLLCWTEELLPNCYIIIVNGIQETVGSGLVKLADLLKSKPLKWLSFFQTSMSVSVYMCICTLCFVHLFVYMKLSVCWYMYNPGLFTKHMYMMIFKLIYVYRILHICYLLYMYRSTSRSASFYMCIEAWLHEDSWLCHWPILSTAWSPLWAPLQTPSPSHHTHWAALAQSPRREAQTWSGCHPGSDEGWTRNAQRHVLKSATFHFISM